MSYLYANLHIVNGLKEFLVSQNDINSILYCFVIDIKKNL